MQTSQITILDYDLTATASKGWAKVGLFGQLVNGKYSGQKVGFQFTQEDAVTAAIELGLMEQPDDRDKDRVGYENPAFSATVRDIIDFERRIQYTDNIFILNEFSGTQFAEDIVRRLALQATEVLEVIQAEAERIALHECPAGIVGSVEVEAWMEENKPEFHNPFGGLVDWNQISDHKKQLWYAAEQETLNSL